ncbi:hypothetical protein SCHPADRAFT_317467 [Schizopora paradoxa]|uniref:Uncharacterized protein n=1 Tax=Schizopora paradoxa TaxID=27342 RepID=A0A0H2RRG1_9AGAM|nr:hypothetical protein SCHPADRAFT_317467 [Schizopora paradoxa]
MLRTKTSGTSLHEQLQISAVQLKGCNWGCRGGSHSMCVRHDTLRIELILHYQCLGIYPHEKIYHKRLCSPALEPRFRIYDVHLRTKISKNLGSMMRGNFFHMIPRRSPLEEIFENNFFVTRRTYFNLDVKGCRQKLDIPWVVAPNLIYEHGALSAGYEFLKSCS